MSLRRVVTWSLEWFLPLNPLWRWLLLRLCSPRYEPTEWNDGGAVQFDNNCYNYACDIRTGTFAQPGEAAGYRRIDNSCYECTQGAQADGLIVVDCDRACPFCCHKVALVIAPGEDFHWYRQDKDGTWSHKPGHTSVVNTDASGNSISDPRTADRDYRRSGGPNYTQFCGCFAVCSCVTIA